MEYCVISGAIGAIDPYFTQAMEQGWRIHTILSDCYLGTVILTFVLERPKQSEQPQLVMEG